MDPNELEDALCRLQRAVAECYPHNLGMQLVVALPGGQQAILPVSPCPPGRTFAPALSRGRSPPARTDAEQFNEAELELLQVIEEMGPTEVLRAEELAERVGRENSGRFRELIAQLVRRGRIKRLTNGYGRPDA